MEYSIVTPAMGLPLPGACRTCGAVDKETYIDTGYEEEYYGAVLYCVECVGYFASLMGFVSPAKAEELRSKVENYYLQQVKLTDKVELLTGAVDALVRSGYNRSDINFIELDMVHLDSLTSPGPQRTENQSGEGNREIDESGNDERMDVLPTNVSEQQPFNLFG